MLTLALCASLKESTNWHGETVDTDLIVTVVLLLSPLGWQREVAAGSKVVCNVYCGRTVIVCYNVHARKTDPWSCPERTEFVGAAKILVESQYFIWWPTYKYIIDHFDDEHFQRARLLKNKNLRSTRNGNEISCEYPFFNG
jgi:hypothetical protein